MARPAGAETSGVRTPTSVFEDAFLVPLDADHPGFRDASYRARRDAIAKIALDHVRGRPVPDAPYDEAEHALWRDLLARLGTFHRAHACREVLDRLAVLQRHRDRIPQLAELNRTLAAASGFRMEPVPGLVAPRAFLAALADGVFLSTQYVRHASRPDYTPEPDVVHEAVGHAACLTDPDVAAAHRAFGRAARAASSERLAELERAYWFTLEFGAVREGGTVKALGAGLLSSVAELGGMLDGPELTPLDLRRIARTDYDPSRPQPRLFVAESFAALFEALDAWL